LEEGVEFWHEVELLHLNEIVRKENHSHQT
jgi:hypothetical protein